jgi:hypothetical protein
MSFDAVAIRVINAFMVSRSMIGDDASVDFKTFGQTIISKMITEIALLR